MDEPSVDSGRSPSGPGQSVGGGGKGRKEEREGKGKRKRGERERKSVTHVRSKCTKPSACAQTLHLPHIIHACTHKHTPTHTTHTHTHNTHTGPPTEGILASTASSSTLQRALFRAMVTTPGGRALIASIAILSRKDHTHVKHSVSYHMTGQRYVQVSQYICTVAYCIIIHTSQDWKSCE